MCESVFLVAPWPFLVKDARQFCLWGKKSLWAVQHHAKWDAWLIRWNRGLGGNDLANDFEIVIIYPVLLRLDLMCVWARERDKKEKDKDRERIREKGAHGGVNNITMMKYFIKTSSYFKRKAMEVFSALSGADSIVIILAGFMSELSDLWVSADKEDTSEDCSHSNINTWPDRCHSYLCFNAQALQRARKERQKPSKSSSAYAIANMAQLWKAMHIHHHTDWNQQHDNL